MTALSISLVFEPLAFQLRGFHLGFMRLTVYGATAALGVVFAVGLSARAASRVGLPPEMAWDAGLLAVLSCLLSSRLLLVLRDPAAFLHFPLLVLGLPSLTYGGMALSAVVVLLVLRKRNVPVLRLLDAFAPGGALLAAFLELGHWLDGSEPGMPIFQRGVAGPLQPVAAYGVAASLLLCGLLWVALRWPVGRPAALGLTLGGLFAFGLDMLALPSALFSDWWLEPGQGIALSAMLAGAVLWTLLPRAAGTRHPV